MSNPTLKELQIEAWHRARPSMVVFHAGQKKIDEAYKASKGQLFVCNISRQWGKSFYAVTKAIELALLTPKARIKYGTAFFTDLREFILPTFDKVLESCPDYLRPTYKTQGSKWVFPNGSEIKLVGLDKSPNSLRGNTIDMIIVDEAGFVDNLQYIYTSVIVPATLHRPNCKILFISTPPATPAHSFVDFVQKAEAEGSYVKLDIYTNPLINQEDIDRMAKELGGYESTSFRRECMCEFVTDSDLAIIPEWNDKYIREVEKDVFHQYYHKYIGMDLGTKDFTACIFGYYDFKKATLVIEDEFHLNGPSMTTEILAGAIKAKQEEMWPGQKPFRSISDSNNPQLLIDLNSIHGLSFVRVDRTDSMEAMINELRLMVQEGAIAIHPRCTQLIGCLKYGVWDEKRKQFARSKVYGHYDHLAALIYLVRMLARHSNPIPVNHGHNNATSWMGNIKDRVGQSPNSHTIRKALIPKHKDILDQD